MLKNQKSNKISILTAIVSIIVLLGLTDLFLTMYLIEHYGIEEANPMLEYIICNFGIKTFAIVKILVTAMFGSMFLFCKKTGALHKMVKKRLGGMLIFLLFGLSLTIYMFVVISQLFFLCLV